MKRKAISILLCMYMTTILLSGCGGDKNNADDAEQIVSDDTAKEEAAQVVTPTPEDAKNLTPEELLTKAVNNFNGSPVREYTHNWGSDWDTLALAEQVKIDENSQLIYVEDSNGVSDESPEPMNYFLTNENGTEYFYISEPSIPDRYIKISGHPLTYTNMLSSVSASFESTADYEISDLFMSLSDPYEYTDGRKLQDVSVSYTKTLPETGTVLEVFDIFGITVDTHELALRIIEIQDDANSESAHNAIEEFYYYTGDNATVLGNRFESYAYSIPAITYEEYQAAK